MAAASLLAAPAVWETIREDVPPCVVRWTATAGDRNRGHGVDTVRRAYCARSLTPQVLAPLLPSACFFRDHFGEEEEETKRCSCTAFFFVFEEQRRKMKCGERKRDRRVGIDEGGGVECVGEERERCWDGLSLGVFL